MSKKQRQPNQAPREVSAIEKEYHDLCHKVGGLQYVIYAQQQELDTLNKKLMEVNNEYALRRKLDAQKAPVPNATAVSLPTTEVASA